MCIRDRSGADPLPPGLGNLRNTITVVLCQVLTRTTNESDILSSRVPDTGENCFTSPKAKVISPTLLKTVISLLGNQTVAGV